MLWQLTADCLLNQISLRSNYVVATVTRGYHPKEGGVVGGHLGLQPRAKSLPEPTSLAAQLAVQPQLASTHRGRLFSVFCDRERQPLKDQYLQLQQLIGAKGKVPLLNLRDASAKKDVKRKCSEWLSIPKTFMLLLWCHIGRKESNRTGLADVFVKLPIDCRSAIQLCWARMVQFCFIHAKVCTYHIYTCIIYTHTIKTYNIHIHKRYVRRRDNICQCACRYLQCASELVWYFS